jgi:putative transposase
MPRYARFHAPGSVVHIISRFVNRDFRMRSAIERAAYIRRVADVLRRSDWIPIAYVLMSSHIHWVAVAGNQPSSSFIQPLHSGFAVWINREQHTLGPVFASRHTTVLWEEPLAANLIAYVHNNPVRAGLVGDAAESAWSSHRAYLGGPAPAWLDVDRGLALSGFGSSRAGRLGFDQYVRDRRGVTRNDHWSANDQADSRAAVRELVGTAVEISSPQVDGPQTQLTLLAPPAAVLRPRVEADPLDVIAAAARYLGVPLDDVRSRNRTRQVVNARRLALLVWTNHLGNTQSSINPVVGLGAQAASQLLRRGGLDTELEAAAPLIAGQFANGFVTKS